MVANAYKSPTFTQTPSNTTPTSTGAYTVGVRSALNGKGVDNSRIGYDPYKGVTVDGNQFMAPSKNYGGAAYTDQTGFNNAWNAFNKPVSGSHAVTGIGGAAGVIQKGGYNPQQQPVQTQTQQQPTNANPYDTQVADWIKILTQQAQNPTPVDVNAIYASPQYAAAQAQQDRASHEAIRAAQESMGASGFGRSTALGERAQGIQNTANEYLQTQILPALMAQQAQEKQQAYQNSVNALGLLQGQQGVYDTRGQNEQSNALQKGQLTGTYMTPELEGLYNQVLADKQTYGAATTPEERAVAKQHADATRQQIAALGGNADVVGSNVAYGQAAGNKGKYGIQTQASKEFDATMAHNKEQDAIANAQWDKTFNLNSTTTMANLTGHLPDGTPTTDEQQRQLGNLWTVAGQTGKIPDQLADLYGIPHGTPTQEAYQFAKTFNQGVKESDRNFGLDQDKFQYGQLQDEAKADAGTKATPAQVKQILQNYQLTGQDPSGKSYKYNPGPGSPARKDWVSSTVQSLVNAGYDNSTIEQVMRSAGVTAKEEDEIFGGTSGK